MNIGIVMPLAEDQNLGRAPRYTKIREMALQSKMKGSAHVRT